MERGVMLEEEMKNSEQEREALRIETQRLRDELSDLRIEADISQEKLRASGVTDEHDEKRLSQTSTSKTWESAITSASTLSMSSGPTPKSDSDLAPSDAPTPPSPPLSDAPAPTKPVEVAPTPSKRLSLARDVHTTPKPGHYSLSRPRHDRGHPVLTNNGINTPSFARRPPKPNVLLHEGVPRSGSLYQIRGLIGKMQRLEERVQSARSKLPGPTSTPPRSSPRAIRAHGVPATVTMRSNKKRISGTTTHFVTPSRTAEESALRISRRQSRLSFGGLPQSGDITRPCSRASNTSHSVVPQFARPDSRRSMDGKLAMIDQPKQDTATANGHPRSSIDGDFTPARGLKHTRSRLEMAEDTTDLLSPTAGRTTLDRKASDTAISTPSTILRRPSDMTALLSSASTMTRAGRTSARTAVPTQRGTDCEMKPPRRRQTDDLGETF